MKNPIFSGTAQIHIQGKRVLRFISLDEKKAQFDIIGLSEPRVRVIDHRLIVRRKMKEILKTEKVEQLTDYFSQPAKITIVPPEPNSNEMVVRLQDTRTKTPRHMLWVAVGISGEIPYYDYKKLEIQPINHETIALFSLYKRPNKKNSQYESVAKVRS